MGWKSWLYRMALIGPVAGASACGAVVPDDASSTPDAMGGVVNVADEPAAQSADGVVAFEQVDSCVDYALYHAFIGNQFWRDVWDDAGKDEQALAAVCESIGRGNPVQLSGFHQDWLVIEAALAPVLDAAPVAPAEEPVPEASGAPSIQVTTRFNADGNDNSNKNDEWVRFTNTGASPLDVSGWSVNDEGEKHRYGFGSLVIEPGASVTLFTGCGNDSQTERYWCNSGSAIWNNDGDVTSLVDVSGALVAQASE